MLAERDERRSSKQKYRNVERAPYGCLLISMIERYIRTFTSLGNADTLIMRKRAVLVISRNRIIFPDHYEIVEILLGFRNRKFILRPYNRIVSLRIFICLKQI